MKDSYPKGTTKEQWDQYSKDLNKHEQFIKDYKFFTDRICRHLNFIDHKKQWTIEEIRKTMIDEIDKSHSMDAPNKPGYFRANND
ncbi:MAG: hypothetical protein K8H85_10330 [Cyclobacteriaceae bacterium]|nr:hypothetical protein [Cyclobacteriaceae bacterium]